MSNDIRSTKQLEVPCESNITDAVWHEVVVALHGLRFGQVTVVVHEGFVKQIDRTERIRLPPSITDAPPAGCGS